MHEDLFHKYWQSCHGIITCKTWNPVGIQKPNYCAKSCLGSFNISLTQNLWSCGYFWVICILNTESGLLNFLGGFFFLNYFPLSSAFVWYWYSHKMLFWTVCASWIYYRLKWIFKSVKSIFDMNWICEPGISCNKIKVALSGSSSFISTFHPTMCLLKQKIILLL